MLKSYRLRCKSGHEYVILKCTTDHLRVVHNDKRAYKEEIVQNSEIPEVHQSNGRITDNSDFFNKIFTSLSDVFPFETAKCLSRRLRRRRNKYGIGLLGPIQEERSFKLGNIAYSRKGVGRKNHKRRTSVSLHKFIKSFGLPIEHAALEKIQKVFESLDSRFVMLSGQAACDVYHLPHGEPFKSCMQKGYHNKNGRNIKCCGHQNDHLFLANPDKLFLACVFKGDKIVSRAKVYKNDNGSLFLSRIYPESLPEYNRFKPTDLSCTLNHKLGEWMPYMDCETVTRIDDQTILVHRNGTTCSSTTGIDPTYVKKCKICGFEMYGHDADSRPEQMCETCIYTDYILYDNIWYKKQDCVYSKRLGAWYPKEICVNTKFASPEEYDSIPRKLAMEHNGEFYYCEHYIIDYRGNVIRFDQSRRINIGNHMGSYALVDDLVYEDGYYRLRSENV